MMDKFELEFSSFKRLVPLLPLYFWKGDLRVSMS